MDFAEAILNEAVFSICNLLGATFDRTNLEKVDFRTATNFSIDPENNQIRKAKFTVDGLVGLVQKYDLKIG